MPINKSTVAAISLATCTVFTCGQYIGAYVAGRYLDSAQVPATPAAASASTSAASRPPLAAPTKPVSQRTLLPNEVKVILTSEAHRNTAAAMDQEVNEMISGTPSKDTLTGALSYARDIGWSHDTIEFVIRKGIDLGYPEFHRLRAIDLLQRGLEREFQLTPALTKEIHGELELAATSSDKSASLIARRNIAYFKNHGVAGYRLDKSGAEKIYLEIAKQGDRQAVRHIGYKVIEDISKGQSCNGDDLTNRISDELSKKIGRNNAEIFTTKITTMMRVAGCNAKFDPSLLEGDGMEATQFVTRIPGTNRDEQHNKFGHVFLALHDVANFTHEPGLVNALHYYRLKPSAEHKTQVKQSLLQFKKFTAPLTLTEIIGGKRIYEMEKPDFDNY